MRNQTFLMTALSLKQGMTPYFFSHYEQLIEDLKQAESSDAEPVGIAKQCFLIAEKFLQEVRLFVVEHPWKNSQEEIHFFKHVKPLFHAHLIYYHKLLQLELDRPPAGNAQSLLDYYGQHLLKIQLFYEENAGFYRYFRSGETYADERYFLRSSQHGAFIHPYRVNTDPNFSTGYDYLIAKMYAFDMLGEYLSLVSSVDANKHPGKAKGIPNDVKWTAPVIYAAELIYGLVAMGALNNGHISARKVAELFCLVFNMKLDGIYKKFEEIRLRKKNRTVFWDAGKKNLLIRMDEDDTHAL